MLRSTLFCKHLQTTLVMLIQIPANSMELGAIHGGACRGAFHSTGGTSHTTPTSGRPNSRVTHYHPCGPSTHVSSPLLFPCRLVTVEILVSGPSVELPRRKRPETFQPRPWNQPSLISTCPMYVRFGDPFGAGNLMEAVATWQLDHLHS